MQPVLLPERRLTYGDLLRFPDDGLRHEIIDGEHFVSASPNLSHQRIVGRLFLELAMFLRQRPSLGEVLLGPFDVVLSDFDVVAPDIVFISEHQQHTVTSRHVNGPPALVIEVLSPSTRRVDETLKYRLFDEQQVGEYWIVDPTRDTVQVYRRTASGGGRLTLAAEASAHDGAALTTPLLRGLAIPVAALFA